MNATQLHFDSSDSEEDLNSKKKKKEKKDPNKSYNEQRLCMKMAILRGMLEGKEIAKISWVTTNTQIVHSLTKKGVPSFKILGFISEPKESSV